MPNPEIKRKNVLVFHWDNPAIFMGGPVDYRPKPIRRLEWNLFEIGRQEKEAPELSTEIMSPWDISNIIYPHIWKIFVDKL